MWLPDAEVNGIIIDMGIEFLIYFSIGGMVGGLMVWMYAQHRHNRALQDECRRMEYELCEYEEMAHNLDEFNRHIQRVKDKRKAKILQWLRDDVVLQSGELASRLDVSTRTVRNYLTEMVEDGLVQQSAEVGRDVSYRIIS